METRKPTTYKGTELNFTINPHGEQERKINIDFDLNGTHYHNAFLTPLVPTDTEIEDGYNKLLKWAKTIINDHQPKK